MKPIEMFMAIGVMALSFSYFVILAMILVRIYFDAKLRYHRTLCEQLMEETADGQVLRRK